VIHPVFELDATWIQIARDPKDIQDRDLEEPLPRKNKSSTISLLSYFVFLSSFSSLNTNLRAEKG